jgi:hypothetical protein
MKLTTNLIVLIGITLCSCQISQAASPLTNIAEGKTVTVSTPSTESYTRDKNPALLTDGKYAGNEYDAENKTSTLWVQNGALTWRVASDPLVITIDLGKTMPISGASYSTAAGRAGVQWPSFIGIMVSEDAKTWHYEGDLVTLSAKNARPPLEGYEKFRYVTHDLKTKGRYISLTVIQAPYTVTDEIEIYKGDDAWLNLPVTGQAFQALDAASITKIVQSGFVQRRVAVDIQAIRDEIKKVAIPATQKSTFTQQLDKAEQQNTVLESGDVKTILPINSTHRSVMATYGELLSAQGFSPLSIWKLHRYAWLPFVSEPKKAPSDGVNIRMLKNEFRSDALLLTNASGVEKTVTLQLKNPPKNAKPGWLQVESAVWTDTYQGIPVADALVPIQQHQGKFSVTIPAGFTGKIWFTVDGSKVASGDYKSTFNIDGQNIPFHLSVSKLAMQRSRMSLTMWDNSDSKSLAGVASRGITLQNKAAALAMMKSHFVDAPWADRPILPWPTAEDFDAQNALTSKLNFSAFDQWVAEWPNARTFFVFINAHENEAFAGAKPETPEFNARLGAYAKVLSTHMKTLGLQPQQLALLIIDEPGGRGDWQDDVIANWANAIHAGSPELFLVSDPAWRRPDLQKNQDAITQMNILIPNTQNHASSPKEVWDYFQQQRKDGKELWLYSATGPVRLFNPQNYYRDQAWRVFSIGGRGMGFWAFCDISGAPTAWNDYQIPTSYSPAFLDKTTVYNSVHWNAVREGVEDFEELAMLRDAIGKSSNRAAKTQAQAVLDDAVKTITATDSTAFWQKETAPDQVDQQLQKVRSILEKLNA